MREFVSEASVQYESGGSTSRLFGAMAFRYWFGTPGSSNLIAGSVLFWEPVRLVDQQAFEVDLKGEIRVRVAQQFARETGLELHALNPCLDRIEYLWIWHPDQETLERVEAFKQGWSRALPPGKRARDLSVADLGRLARRMGVIPRYDPVAEVIPSRKDTAAAGESATETRTDG